MTYQHQEGVVNKTSLLQGGDHFPTVKCMTLLKFVPINDEELLALTKLIGLKHLTLMPPRTSDFSRIPAYWKYLP